MENTTTILIGICIVLFICIVIVFILYFKNTPDKYFEKKLNEVDTEIEKELKQKK